MLKELTITELDSYLRLCECNMEYLAAKRRLNHLNRAIEKDYDSTLYLRNKIYVEINNRLKDLIEKDELTEETVQEG